MKITITDCSAASAMFVKDAINAGIRTSTSAVKIIKSCCWQNQTGGFSCDFEAMAAAFPNPITSSLEIGASMDRSHDRLYKCLRNFQRISDIKRVTIDVTSVFGKLSRNGFSLKEVLSIIKIIIRHELSHRTIEEILYLTTTYEDGASKLANTLELKMYNATTEICDPLIKEVDKPHYRDTEVVPLFSQVESRKPINNPIQGRCY